jgi:hypothetical protein
MTDKLLYYGLLPSTRQRQGSQQDQAQRRVSTQGVLDSDTGSVESVSTQPSGESIEGQYLGKYADVMAQELQELANSSGYAELPYYTLDGEGGGPEDGYVVINDLNVGRVDPNSEWAHMYRGSISKVGTRRSHLRAVETSEDAVNNPFGTGESEELGISARAEDARWIDRLDGSTEPATPVTTREGEKDHVTIFDAADTSITDPTLVFDVPYRHERPTDCRVFDDCNRDKREVIDYSGDTVGGATVGSTTVRTQRVIENTWPYVAITSHEWVGNPVLESGILRLVHDRDRRRLMASRWNATEGQYNRVQLGTSPWRLHELDLRRVGAARIEARTRWRDDTGSERALTLSLKRGWDDALWTAPTNATAPPQALLDRLEPIAATTEWDLGATQGLVTRAEVPAP